MKKMAFILLSIVMVACSTEKDQEQVVRDLAKKDIIEKLQLPEGTKFTDENIEVIETETGEGSLGVSYLVKITVKSQDREGNEVVKTHTFQYKKTGEGGLSEQDYELVSFE